MRRIKRYGSFLMGLLINMMLNLEWSIPAWVLFGLHFWLGISIWWFVGAVAIWILRLMLGMWVMKWASACGRQKDPQKENKNPYSKTNRDVKE